MKKTGHAPLKWGAFGVVGGYALAFLGGSVLLGALTTVGALISIAGLVAWIVGLIQRIAYNRSAEEALPFTVGEKISLIGGAVALLGILIVNGSEGTDAAVAGQIIGIAGLVALLGGFVWHLMTERRGQNKGASQII
ncbi:hypothetical protein [Brevibacterium yomogidense]|uniref:hypothetical protein n=1 Tax=Brevibacterium yomogidense TaxID=946573 RepID=UPI000B363037|nr:hypothetical protein [Brevibacterium yomogidense]